MKRADLEQAGKSNIFGDEDTILFLNTVCQDKLLNDDLIMHRLTCGGTTVTLAFSIFWQGRLTYYMASYERGQLSQCSPGLLALCRIFEWCIAERHQQFDFMIGDERYKLESSDQKARLYCGTFAVTAKGHIGERFEAAKFSLKHTIKSSLAMYSVASKLLFHMHRPD